MLSKKQGWVILRAAILVFVFACGVGATAAYYQWSFSDGLRDRDVKQCEQTRVGRETSRRNAYIDNQNTGILAIVLANVAELTKSPGIRQTTLSGASLFSLPARKKPILVRLHCNAGTATPVEGSAGHLMHDELDGLPRLAHP